MRRLKFCTRIGELMLSLQPRARLGSRTRIAMSHQQPQRAGSPPEFLVKVREILSSEDDSIISWENGAHAREAKKGRALVRAR